LSATRTRPGADMAPQPEMTPRRPSATPVPGTTPWDPEVTAGPGPGPGPTALPAATAGDPSHAAPTSMPQATEAPRGGTPQPQETAPGAPEGTGGPQMPGAGHEGRP
jgi:hypothetical protein